eukprot:481203-Alexandrium_andersonii.AAC.1
MQPILRRQPREPAPPSQMSPLCPSALRTTLRPGQRSKGKEWLGWPSQAGWSGWRRPHGHLRRAPAKRSRA